MRPVRGDGDYHLTGWTREFNEGKIIADVKPEFDKDKGVTTAVQRVRNQMPCDGYLARGWLSGSQFQASQLMLREWTTAGLQVLQCQSWVWTDSSDKTLTGRQIDAKRQLFRTLEHLEPISASLVVRICCEGQTATNAGRAYNRSRQYVMKRLKKALDDVVRFRLTGGNARR